MAPIYSFVVDSGPNFAYQAWHLSHSLMSTCGARRSDIHIQCTPEVDVATREVFDHAGFCTHTIPKFGDGRYCNKIGQLDNLRSTESSIVVLLDTDTIAVSDLRPWLRSDVVLGKIVDAPNPPLETLREIAWAAQLRTNDICEADSGTGKTYAGNFNGGFYSIPRVHCSRISHEWRRWAQWLLDNGEPLQRVGKGMHVDQVSFWLALLSTGIPFECAASNVNYFTHFRAPHRYLDTTRDIALIHYHNVCLDVLGKLNPPVPLDSQAQVAVARANSEIGRNFNNRLFWDYRYRSWPDRGSGIGSRGKNLLYKRELLRQEGLEDAVSVLDIGCGDTEVLSRLRLSDYIGVDSSPMAIERARMIMPNAEFHVGLPGDVPAADFVLCLEVLIHQPSLADYFSVLDYAVSRANRTLIMSGYQMETEAITKNSMVFFHEPLEESLRRTAKFVSIREVGAHTDVTIFRCDARAP